MSADPLSSAAMEEAQRLKSQQRKEHKIKLYGRAHSGPRRRKRSRRPNRRSTHSHPHPHPHPHLAQQKWAKHRPSHGFPLPLPSVREVPLSAEFSGLPLANAKDTAATAAFSVLDGEVLKGHGGRPAGRLDIRRFSDTLFQTAEDDPESLEQLVQDLAKALPTPGHLSQDIICFAGLEVDSSHDHDTAEAEGKSAGKGACVNGKAEKEVVKVGESKGSAAVEGSKEREREAGGAGQDPSRDARVAHVVKLAEEERERRIKENDASNLKDMLERARRIEWAVRAIEGERERRAQMTPEDNVLLKAKAGAGDVKEVLRAREGSRNGVSGHGPETNEGRHGGKGERRASESEYKEYTEDYDVICPYSSFGCEKECLRSELPAHFQECPARLELEGFEEPGVYNPLNYIVACPFKIVGCDYLCKRTDLPEHLLTCPARVYDHYMSDPDPYEESLDAYEVICPYSTLGCEFTCPRSAVSEHLSTCVFRPKTRHDEEDERARNKVLAIAAAETERARRMSDSKHGKEHVQSSRNREFINAVLAAVASRNPDGQGSERSMSKQRVEWFVRAAEIEIVRQDLEKRLLITSARSASCNGSVISSGDAPRSSVASSLCLEESSDCSDSGMGKSRSSQSVHSQVSSIEEVIPTVAQRQPPHANPFQDHLARQAAKLNSLLHQAITNYSVKCIKSCQGKQRQIKEVVAKLCKEAKACFSSPVYVHVFGSYATELAVPGFSDLDVVLTMSHAKQNKKKKERSLAHAGNNIDAALKCNILGRSLKRVKWVDSVKVLDRAHIPVVKLSTKGLDVDLTFALPLHGGLQTVAFVRDLKQMYPALTPLTLVLKTFLAKASLSDPFTGGLSSYALLLMIVASIRKSHEKGTEFNLGALLVDFLELFGRDFDPGRDAVVCVEGPAMAVAKRETVDHGQGHASLLVFDPISPGNNVARSCFRINAVQKLFADALASFLSVLVRSDAIRNYDGASLLREILLCD